jgi:two-component system, response regulator PdtaR
MACNRWFADCHYRRYAPSSEIAASMAKVLILEDDQLIVMGLAESLVMAGYEVTGSAASVPEALALAERLPPDLAIVDVRLRGPEDGIAGAGLLRRLLNLPILFLTGEIDPAMKTRAAALSAVLLIKPVHADILIRTIESIIGGT